MNHNKYSNAAQHEWLKKTVKTCDEMTIGEFIAWCLILGGVLGTIVAAWLVS